MELGDQPLTPIINKEEQARKTEDGLTAGRVVPPAGHCNPLSLAGACIVLEPAAGCLHSTPINTGVKQTVFVEEGGVDFAVTLGKASILVGDEATQLLHFGETFNFGTGWAAVPTAHLAEGVSLHPALPKLVDAQCKQPHGHLQVIIRVAIVASTKAIGAVLHVPGESDGQEGFPIIHNLQAKVSLHHHVKAKRKDVYLPLS